MARQKEVFGSAEQAIHVWAQRTQCGRNRSGNVFFDRASIWSYGNHFRMAQFVTNDRGDVACLVNPAKYSVTTSRHQYEVRRAIPSYVRQFDAPGAAFDHAETLAHYERESVEAWIKASRARSNVEWRIREARDAIESFNRYAEFFGLPDRLEMPADAKSAIAAAQQRERERAERQRIADEQRARDRAIEAKRQKRRDRDNLRKWLAGANVRPPRSDDVYLRVRGDAIETSWGANVPLAVAPMLWDHVQRARATGTGADYRACNMPVGHFQLRAIDDDGGLHVGCHYIRFAELQRIARAIGLDALAAAA